MQSLKKKLRIDGAFNRSNENYFFSIAGALDTSRIIEKTLRLPYKKFIENSPILDHKIYNDDLFDESDGVSLSLTTASCYESALTMSVTGGIMKRFGINDDRLRIRIHTCLHEAIINSVLHGNLQVKSNFYNADELYKNQEIIFNRLGIDLYRYKRVNILIWNNKKFLKIGVRDDGNGFELSDYIKTDGKARTSFFGRGLAFINSMANEVYQSADKRTLFMVFE